MGCHAKKLQELVFFEVINGTESEITQKQCEKHILLVRIQKSAVLGKIPRDFRNTGENQKIAAVFFSVMGVPKAFHQEKTEDGKGNSSDIAENAVKGVAASSKRKKGNGGGPVMAQQMSTCMVYEHGEHRQHLQGAAA